MAKVWIEDLSNRHCPTCDERLVAPAGRFDPLGRTEPTYVQDGNPGGVQCPAGHRLPDDAGLAAYAQQRGHEPPEQGSPVREVPPPR